MNLSLFIESGLAVLPPKMDTLSARMMLFAIGFQESGFKTRHQLGGGPAHGFWQFEETGVDGVLKHHASNKYVADALAVLRYPPLKTAKQIHEVIQHNDGVACVFARLLLWTFRDPLPMPDNHEEGWRQYLSLWRPGKPHPENWKTNFEKAKEEVMGCL